MQHEDPGSAYIHCYNYSVLTYIYMRLSDSRDCVEVVGAGRKESAGS